MTWVAPEGSTQVIPLNFLFHRLEVELINILFGEDGCRPEDDLVSNSALCDLTGLQSLVTLAALDGLSDLHGLLFVHNRVSDTN